MEHVDWESLSPSARSAARKLGPMLSSGFSATQVARYYGKTPGWVTAQMKLLRDEIRDQVKTTIERRSQREHDDGDS
jgi:hypothetical protein